MTKLFKVATLVTCGSVVILYSINFVKAHNASPLVNICDKHSCYDHEQKVESLEEVYSGESNTSRRSRALPATKFLDGLLRESLFNTTMNFIVPGFHLYMPRHTTDDGSLDHLAMQAFFGLFFAISWIATIAIPTIVTYFQPLGIARAGHRSLHTATTLNDHNSEQAFNVKWMLNDKVAEAIGLNWTSCVRKTVCQAYEDPEKYSILGQCVRLLFPHPHPQPFGADDDIDFTDNAEKENNGRDCNHVYRCFFDVTNLSFHGVHFIQGQQWPPGSPWPLPFSWTSIEKLVTFDPATFKIVKNFTGTCEPIDFAIQKYNQSFLFPVYGNGNSSPDPSLPVVAELVVTLSDNEQQNECLQYPKLSDDPETHEHYDLGIRVTENKAIATLEATTVWGALRGIETFSQLIWPNDDYEGKEETHFFANITEIHDKPRFSHRGLMIDSARHYLPERIFYEILDGMMYNKLNVLHWHIVDDQSFPFVCVTFPELSAKGAYNDKAVYTPEAVQRVINGARLRGIRVILEFDTPGHTLGFGTAFPELLTPCYGNGPNGSPDAPNFPKYEGRQNLDPTQKHTYDFMREFFTEIAQNVSKDSFVHVGMDEVYMGCWEPSHNPVIKEFMSKNGYTDLHQVQEHYTMRHVEMVKSLGLTPISWQDPLDYNVNLDKDVVIQAWKNWGTPWGEQFKIILAKGYRTILSSPWYLDVIEYGETWRKYYKIDPIKSVPSLTDEEKSRILGGEACIWIEYVDKTNIIPRIFPFVSAIGERLWTFDIGLDDTAVDNARRRLDQHRCRMLRRGLPVQPISMGYCGRWETENRRRRR
ncbi:unnamed protein product [Orchesella dallaii]|uniref:beta-N-acetylhexosaminidase n=1 Tax=Orchesella dallaii TaxID=48710 RepID=A0ABP1RCM6_9HEXA